MRGDRGDFTAAGELGLLAAVIYQAAWDAQHGGPDLARDAWQYLLSDIYRDHLTWLGLDHYRLPQELIT